MVTVVCGSSSITRPAVAGLKRSNGLMGVGLPCLKASQKTLRKRQSVVVRAEESSSSDVDFDAILMKVADKFEKSENKPVIVGYGVGAVVALFFTEWLIHLPGLNFLLGFPAQLFGLLVAPVLVVRYFIDGKDVVSDIEAFVEKLGGLLPGLKD